MSLFALALRKSSTNIVTQNASSERRERHALRWKPYLAVQLEFAATVAAATGVEPADAVSRYTNLHRRFGLGRIDQPDWPGPYWRDFLAALATSASGRDKLEVASRFLAQAPPEVLVDSPRRFGCFSYDPPDTAGELRIHFGNYDTDATGGPLVAAKLERRLAELTALVTHVRTHAAEAIMVRGGSWLYQLPAYRRLFPPVYAAARHAPTRPVSFHGNSSWGQFLTAAGDIHLSRVTALRTNLPRFDPAAPWAVFPLPVLATTAPIEVFYDHYL